MAVSADSRLYGVLGAVEKMLVQRGVCSSRIMKELNGMRESTREVTGRTKMLKVLNKRTSKIKSSGCYQRWSWVKSEQFEVSHQNTAWIPGSLGWTLRRVNEGHGTDAGNGLY